MRASVQVHRCVRSQTAAQMLFSGTCSFLFITVCLLYMCRNAGKLEDDFVQSVVFYFHLGSGAKLRLSGEAILLAYHIF